jgi:hypothetical protein
MCIKLITYGSTLPISALSVTKMSIKHNVLSGVMVSVIIPSVVMLSVVRFEDTSACNSSQLILIIILPPQKVGANPFCRINTFQPTQNAPMIIMKL